MSENTNNAGANAGANATNNATNNGRQFAIQRIYVKDLSFESPRAPQVFREGWEPQVNVEVDTDSSKLADDVYNAELRITVTVKQKEQTAFLIEVTQGGIFGVKGFDEQQMGPMLGSYCPNILFPYVREVISEAVAKGGFPPLYLAPINFDVYYAQKAAKAKDNKDETAAADTAN